jgi:hypothetical protein
MYSFRAKKVMKMLSDPNWDHNLPFLQPGDVPHAIAQALQMPSSALCMLLMVMMTAMCPWMLLPRVQKLPPNCSLRGSCPLIPLVPMRGRRCENCQYHRDDDIIDFADRLISDANICLCQRFSDSKARLIVRYFETEKGKACVSKNSPTPGIAIAGITSIAAR